MFPPLLIWAFSALAVDGQTDGLTQAPPRGLADYLVDLGSEEGPERVYAARYVRGELRRALHVQRVATAGTTEELESRVVLAELFVRVPEACRSALTYTNTAALCAEMLADLEVETARAQVEAARALDLSKGQRKRLEAAITRLPAAPAGPAGTAAPGAPTEPVPPPVSP